MIPSPWASVGIPILCLLLLHSPDGQELLVRSERINMIKPASEYHDHLNIKTNTIIYAGDKQGVQEIFKKISDMLEKCGDQIVGYH